MFNSGTAEHPLLEHLMMEQSNNDGETVVQRCWNSKTSDGGTVELRWRNSRTSDREKRKKSGEQWNRDGGTVEHLMV